MLLRCNISWTKKFNSIKQNIVRNKQVWFSFWVWLCGCPHRLFFNFRFCKAVFLYLKTAKHTKYSDNQAMSLMCKLAAQKCLQKVMLKRLNRPLVANYGTGPDKPSVNVAYESLAVAWSSWNVSLIITRWACVSGCSSVMQLRGSLCLSSVSQLRVHSRFDDWCYSCKLSVLGQC